jgi:hypothetical protein
VEKDKVIIMVGVALVFVVATLGVLWLLSLSAPAPFEEKITSLTIDGPDSIEVGESVSYEAILDGEVCLVGFPEVTWEIRGGQIISNNGSSVTLMTHQPGEMTLMVKFSGMTAQKVIQVHPRAEVSLDMETWIHPGQWYSTGVSFSGTTNPSLILYRLLETGRMVEVSPSIWESYGSSEIVIHENGNYVLVVEGKALSDGRVVREEKDLTVTPYVQRDYHQFSWDNENLVQLTPADKVAIQLFLEEELGVPEVDLLSEGKLRDVNRIASDYVFYKDSSRGDTLLYQTGVKSEGTTTRHVLQSSIKGSDARYVYICWDDFIVSANIGNPGVSFVDPTSGGGDSGSSGGGSSLPPPIGGGPSPSPPIGGEGPSPLPPIGEGPSPPPPIGGGGPSPPPSV